MRKIGYLKVFILVAILYFIIRTKESASPSSDLDESLEWTDALTIPKSRLLNLVPTSSVPKLLHQIYSDDPLPRQYAEWHNTCRDLHSEYIIKIWRDSDLLDLVTLQYPSLLPLWNHPLAQWIHRVDVSKYLILYTYGGVFLDLDVECLRPLDTFLDLGDLVFTQLEHGHINQHLSYSSHNVPNSFMISPPGHPILNHFLRNLTVSGVSRLEAGSSVEEFAASAFVDAQLRSFVWDDPGARIPSLTILAPGKRVP
jgi:mannosyltransferase OCH1-like enzyme